MTYSKFFNISDASWGLDQEGEIEWFREECLEGISFLVTEFDFRNRNKIAFRSPEG